MRSLSELGDINIFFYYGENDIETETESDITLEVVQPKRSLFYHRASGCGLSEYENYPNTMMLEIMSRFDIAKAIYRRNLLCGDGSNNTKERRVAMSQWSIEIKREQGNIDFAITYIPFADYRNIKSVSLPVGVRNA
jgi:hypothetical protein